MSVWISRLKVYRFGAFQDRSLPDFQPGLNLLYGPNESGKTTLMMFLRAMLFGFEGRGRSPYDPLDGGEPGGNLTLKDDQGQEWLLERWGRGRKAKVTVSGPGGLVPGEVGLVNLIQNVHRAVYENIFAFGLAELADLKTLNQQGVKELLYSASLGLGQVSLAAVEGELKDQSKKLFIPKKQAKSTINQILAELDQVRQDLHRLEGQPQEYQKLCQELEGVLKEIVDLEGKGRQSEEKLLWLKKLSQAWPVWESWHLTRADLEALPLIEDFPEDGLGRLDGIKAGLTQVEEHLGELLPELEESRRVVTGLAPKEKLLELSAAIEALWEERVLFEDRREELGRREKELAAGQARSTKDLAEFGLGWDEERLANFNLSLSWRQDGLEWRERLGEAQQVVGQAEERLNYCQAALQEKEAVLERTGTPDLAAGAGWFFRWGLTTLGLFLGLAAGLGYSLAARPIAAWLARE